MSDKSDDKAPSDPSGGVSSFKELVRFLRPGPIHYGFAAYEIEWVPDRTRSLYNLTTKETDMGMIQEPITGCIVRIFHDNKDALNALAHEFAANGYDEVEITEIFNPAVASVISPFCLRHKRNGNLDLDAWLRVVAGELEDIRIDGEMPNLGDTLHVAVELVH